MTVNFLGRRYEQYGNESGVAGIALWRCGEGTVRKN
jgi:hypothetical protein